MHHMLPSSLLYHGVCTFTAMFTACWPWITYSNERFYKQIASYQRGVGDHGAYWPMMRGSHGPKNQFQVSELEVPDMQSIMTFRQIPTCTYLLLLMHLEIRTRETMILAHSEQRFRAQNFFLANKRDTLQVPTICMHACQLWLICTSFFVQYYKYRALQYMYIRTAQWLTTCTGNLLVMQHSYH